MQPWLRATSAFAAVVTTVLTPALPLRTVSDIPLGGKSPRFDYQTIDPTTGRLYIAHEGDGQVLVFDLRHWRVARRIGGLADVHGVLVAPAIHRLYATATALHQLVVIDTRTDQIVARHRAGVVPDGIAYDAASGEVYISDERPAGAVIAADARSGRVLETIALGGSAGNVQYDRIAHRVVVGVETRDQLAVIGPSTHAITRRVPVPGCRANHSLLVDPRQRLLLVGCSGNGRLVVLDADSFRELGHVDGAGHVDVLALDPGTHRAYSSSEDGIVTVLQLRDGQAPRVLGQKRLAPRAHSIVVDPATHLVYLPLGRAGGASVLRIMRPTH